jgi:hypothetical protein
MEQTPNDLNFVFLEQDSGGIINGVIVNLALVRMVTEMRPDHCLLHFSGNHVVNLNGPAAIQIIRLLVSRSVLADGRPLGPFLESTTQSQEPVPPEDPSQGA